MTKFEHAPRGSPSSFELPMALVKAVWLHLSKAKSCLSCKCRLIRLYFAWLELSAQVEVIRADKASKEKPC